MLPVAQAVKERLPAVAGVPVTSLAEALIFSPGGSAPAEIGQVQAARRRRRGTRRRRPAPAFPGGKLAWVPVVARYPTLRAPGRPGVIGRPGGRPAMARERAYAPPGLEGFTAGLPGCPGIGGDARRPVR